MSEPTDTATNEAPVTPAAEPAPAPAPDPAPPETGLEDGTALGGNKPEPEKQEGDKAAAPVVPDTYELTAPEGFTMDQAALEAAAPVFKDMGLSNEQAQKLMPVAADFAQRIKTAGEQQLLQSVVAERKAWFDTAKADAEIGGANWDTSTALAAKALDTLGFEKGSPFRVLLDDSGLGNHPEMIRAFVRVGKAISEDGFETASSPAAGKKTLQELFYPNQKS